MKTKSLPKTFLTLLALMACLFMRLATATAQTMSVPYEPTFGETPPEGWITNNYNYEIGIWGTGIAYLTPGLAVLPQFNQNLNTLELAISLKPNNSQNIQIGYVTNPNDASTFTALQTYDSWYNTTYTAYETKRIYFFYAPANARMAIRCNGSWYIGYLEVYAPAAESLPYTESFASHPSGWGVPSTMTLSDEVLQGSGTVVLPAFNQSIASAMIGAWIKPGNNTSSNSYLQIGYLTDPYNANTFTAFTDCTYNYRSSWTDFEFKTYNNLSIFDTYPNGRLALKCVGSWIIDYVEVYVPTSKTLPYGQEFSQPNSWVLPSTFIISNGILQGSGTIIFPAFNQSLASAVLDMLAKPGSGASDIYIGTVTNPNNPIFVSYGIIASSNSSWTDWKSASYSNLQFLNNSSARLAIKFNGNWMVDMVSLYEPFGLPYTPSLGSTKPGEWLSNNYHHLSSFPYTYLSTGYTVLPKFTVDLNTLQLQVDIGGYIVDGLGGIDFRIGYLTNPLNTSTFTVLKTVTTASGTIRVSFQNAPANARIAIYSNGNWSIRNFSVYTTNPMNVPYDATLPTSGQPEGWLADNYNYGQYYGGYLTTGCAVLPQFNANLNTLQLDISLAPFGSETQNISIGYVTDPNNPNTFTAIKTYTLWSYGVFQPKRVFYNVSGLPTNARMAIYSNGNWKIRNVHVEAVATYPVPYTASLNNTSLPEGWMTDYYFYSNGGAYLTSGCTILPQFSTSISSLQLDIALKPNNTYSQNISIGYVTNNNPSSFTAIQTFYNASIWSDYQPKCIPYSGVPNGARMAIFCNGDWGIGGVQVRTIQSGSTTFNVPYQASFIATMVPEGWIASNYYYSGGVYFTTGCAILPQFNSNLNVLQLDVMVKPKSSNSQYIQIGYVTNNNAATFTALQTFSYTSSWDGWQNKRVVYNVSGLPTGARMAINCNGEWRFDYVKVDYIPGPISAPYFATLDYDQPAGWIANNYSLNGFNPRFTTGYALLPEFNVPIHRLELHVDFRHESSAQSISVGYVINNNLSTFTPVWTYDGTYTGWQDTYVTFYEAPSNARMVIRFVGEWYVDIVGVSLLPLPTMSVPYTQNFENVSIGSLPEGWYAPNMSVQSTYPHSGTKQLAGNGYIVFPVIENAELNTQQLQCWARPKTTSSGGIVRIGYIPNDGTTSQFVEVKNVEWNTQCNSYIPINAIFANAPTGARLVLYCMGYGGGSDGNPWYLDDIRIAETDAIPYNETFATSYLPQGWSTYTGALNWSYSSSTYTNVTLTPNFPAWQFGTQNGVFNSHAYAKIGATSQDYKWLISPPIILGNANDIFLCFDLAMSRESGTQVPLTPDEQDNQYFSVLVSNDGGSIWHELRAWRHENGFSDLESLDDFDDTYNSIPLSAYQNTTIQVAFYAECTDANDNNNHVHIDNVSIQSYDLTAPPASVTVSEIAGHSAKVSWTRGMPLQNHWDVCVCGSWYYQPPTELIQHVDGLLQYYATGLEPSGNYKAWVRYNDGTTTSDWTVSNTFETISLCANPTNLQVEVTQHTALFTWDPGQSNQTTWDTWWDGDDIGIVVVDQPFRLIENIDYNPEGDYNFWIRGYCEDGDGESSSIDMDFNVLPPLTLTVNDGTSTSYTAVINAYETNSNYASTQFVIPANEIMDMQYGTIQQLQFYCSNVTNGTPWGNAQFRVYLKEVDFGNYSEFCDDSFYPWSDMSSIYEGSLSISDGVMTITPNEVDRFYYQGGDLLVGIYQYEAGSFGQAQWYGVVKNNPMSGYIDSQYDEDIVQCSTFAPKVTFTYELDDYLPPTDFEAYVTGGYEVTYMWTPRPGQTGIDIMVGRNPQFNGDYMIYENLDDDFFVDYDELFYQPETTYYYRCRGVYYENGEYHRSAWSTTGSFTTPDACEPPANLTVSDVGPFSAHFEWVSNAEYVNLEYREHGEDQYQYTTLENENFESNNLPLGWRTTQGNNSNGSGWLVSYVTSGTNSNAYMGRGCIASGGTSGRINDWIIIPISDLHGELTFYAKREGSLTTSLRVNVSTNGNQTSDFTQVATISPTTTYALYTVDLTQYSGSGYIALQHIRAGVTSNLAVYVDNFRFRAQNVVPSYGDWIYVGSIEENQIDLYNLTPGTNYEARVRAMCETGYASSWTTPVSFSTPGNIVFEDENAESVCLGIWDTNQDNYLSYAEAAAVQDLDGAFEEQDGIISFNELQYFTGLTEIGDQAFVGCASLNAITLPNTITSIESYAFGSCSSLQGIVIPPSVTTIGDFAFSESGLTEIDLPYSVTHIGALAFGDCNNLVSVYLPATVSDIYGNAFTGTAIANIEVDAGNPVYDSRDGCNAIIETATNTLITGCKNTVVPYGVTAIGVSAFENCSNLTDITLPASVEMLGNYAFLNCRGLNTIEVNATTPPNIGQATFANLTPGNIKVYVPCDFYDVYAADSDWNVFDLVENCNIVFEDNLTKELCVNAWDRNFDGELSYREAAAVTSLNNEFYGSNITRFNELQYFTGLTSIGEEDFGDCERLVAVTLPPTVTQIESYAFENCQSLTNITFGENIGTIHNYAFSTCQGLWFIKVEATTPPSLGEDAFYGAEIDIPVYVPCGTKTDYQNDSDWDIFEDYNIVDMCDTIQFADAAVRAICLDNWDTNNDGYLSYGEAAAVTSIGEVFSGNLSIQTFNELWYFTGLTEISDNAFMGCAWLSSIEMPPTIAHIGSLAFYNTQLNNMYIPYATQTIGWLAFGSCNSLTSFSIPPSVTYIEGNPFSNCPALNYIWVESGNPVYDARNNCKAIIETATNTLVTGCKNTIIPDDVTALGSYAFSGQTALTSITIPSTVVEMGNGVFENCSGLTEVNVQAEIPPTLGYNVFEGVSDDLVINIPCGTKAAYTESWAPYAANLYDGCAYIEFADANVEAICASNWGSEGHITYAQAAAVTTLNTSGESNSSVFKGNQAITSFDELQYFTGLTSIEAYAFSGCRALTSITLPPAITSIGNYAFVNCRVLTPFALPSTLTSIESAAFGNCYALTAIDLPENLISIGGSAFQGCTSLTSIVIPASVTDIGTNPFRNCSALESITVDPENPKYDSRDGCNAIIHTRALGSTTLTFLISGCKNTVIPDGVTAINGYAFAGITELTSITLPSSLTSISYYAFQNCTGLQSITVLATTPPSLNASSPFDLVPTDIPVYVPCGSKAAYQAADGWSTFTNIQADCAEVVQTIELVAGYNWVSTYINGDPIELLEALQAGLGDNGVSIEGPEGLNENLGDGFWWGDLDYVGIACGTMYLILVEDDCTVNLTGMPVDPSTVEITINPGYNWIGFPGMEEVEVEVALQGFEAEDGDAIEGPEGMTEYLGDGMWWGDFDMFVPGQGYMYNSASGEVKTLVFQTGGSKVRVKVVSPNKTKKPRPGLDDKQ